MPLKFKAEVKYYANLYFFIQNLSEWHFSNRKEYNITWRNELLFSSEAEFCIKKFKKIHKKYLFGKKYLGRLFFLYENPWPKVEKLTSKTETIAIKNIFEVLEPYFLTIYKKGKLSLEKWKTVIESHDFLKKSQYFNKQLARFYNSPPYNQSCTIYLLLSTNRKNGGTAGTIKKNAIALELSQVSLRLKKHILGVIWHELIHLHFRKKTLYPLLVRKTKNNKKYMKRMDELIASALLPNGLLKNKILIIPRLKKTKIFNTRLDSFKVIWVQKLICPYLKQKKPINEELVFRLLKNKRG